MVNINNDEYTSEGPVAKLNKIELTWKYFQEEVDEDE